MDSSLILIFTQKSDSPPFVCEIFKSIPQKLDHYLKGVVLKNNRFDCISNYLNDNLLGVDMIILEDTAVRSKYILEIEEIMASCDHLQVVLHTGSASYDKTRDKFVDEVRNNGTTVEAINSHHVPTYTLPDSLNDLIEHTFSKRYDETQKKLNEIRQYISKKNFLK